MSQAFTCPHLDHVDDAEFQRLFNKVAAVRAEDPELFDFTHRQISVYPSDAADQEDPPVVTEDDILRQFDAQRHGNYAVIIEGEVGTGKSELCAYLVHQLREQRRPILRVDKDDDLMTILTQRLPDFHEQHFGESLPQKDKFQQLEADIENIPHVVANSATSGAVLRFTSQGFDVSVTSDDEEVIKDIVEERLEKLVKRGEYGKRMDIISKQQYEREDALAVFEESLSTTEAIDTWNDALWNEIQDRYETPSLSEMLKLVGQRFEDTRPVAVFEDFGIASVEAKKLRNYIERDIDEDNWDFIIAGTRDITEVLHTQTAEDRFEFYQTNRPDSNSVLFLDKDSAVDFIRPYLGYFKHYDDSVNYERDEVGNLVQLLDPAPDSECTSCNLCSDEYRDLFPFNETFLRRIYGGLEESQQSPREYVSKVFDILYEYYVGGTAIPSSSNQLGSDVNNSETPADEVYEHKEEFADFAKWYGEKQDGYYQIDSALAYAFGLIPERKMEAEYDAGVQVTPEVVKIPAGDVKKKKKKKGKDDDDEPKTRVERIFDECRGDVDDWIDDPKNSRFTKTNNYIRTAVEDLINHITDDYTIWSDSDLRYNLSSQRPPFVWENSVDDPQPDQIVINPREFRRSEIRDLLRHGIEAEENADTFDREQQLENHGSQFTDYGQLWRKNVRENFIEDDLLLYRRSYQGRYDFDDFVIASYAWLVLLDNPWKPLTPERINERYTDDEELSIDSYLDSQLEYFLNRDTYVEVTELFDHVDELEDLVEARFGVTTSALDVRSIRERFNRATPYEILDALAKTYIDKVNGRVRFAPKNTLPDIANAVYSCFNSVDDLEEEDTAPSVSRHALLRLRETDMDRINEIARDLKTYNTVESSFNTALQHFSDHDQSDILEVRNAAKFMRNELEDEFGSPTDQNRVHAELANLKLFGHPVFRDLDALEEEWATPGENGAGTRFTEVAEHYVQ